ncbi:cytoskeletal protein binding protein [Arachnomyces sp. PD_36]|nr:cytoskeletal protein binding protein [Arachnomyces sp. PD_36]
MGFLGVYTALYDYQPQSEGELDIREGDLLYVLEKSSEDDWWKAKKKAVEEDDDEPVGLIPNNYVEEAQPVQHAKALYDYTRQTDEEVSFTEDAELTVYDTSDPDWTLVGVNDEFGFAPANYIEILDSPPPQAAIPAATRAPAPVADSPPPQPAEPEEEDLPTPSSHPASPAAATPASAIAGILSKSQAPQASRPVPSPPVQPPRPTYTPDDSDGAQSPPPALPQRPPSEQISPPLQQSPRPPPRPISPPEPSPPPRTHFSSLREEENGGVQASPPFSRVAQNESPMHSPSGYHLYNINEMVSVMGKRKKMPTTIGINVATGTIFISPEKSRDGPQQEWTADKLTHYSIEGKHVFMDLVRPSKNVDFHAGAKDTAQEIVAWLGEIAGGYKAEGLREVIAAGAGGNSLKKGQILYDFMAQGDDEATVAAGDDVVILDDLKSEEWWMVRRVKNGREGVVPSSYIEATGLASVQSPSNTGINAGRSTVEQNRLEEARLAKNVARKSKGSTDSSERHKRNSRSDGKSSSKPKPDPTKTRQWTDRTGTFSVEAQFIGLTDGKIHLHKQNGVKIAVPVAKMSVEDLEYVEKATGESLDEDKPLSDIRRRSLRIPNDADKSRYHGSSDSGRAGVPVGASRHSDYDWFDLFLKAGVGPHQCERYAQNFNRDSMDESVLPDITTENLRTLGLKEGDILRVMKYLDTKFNRTGSKSKLRNVSFEDVDGETNGSGGLFSGPGGALRNNTRKGRPTPPVQTNDVVDAKAFESGEGEKKAEPKPEPTPAASTPADDKPVSRGFDDNAWEVKPPKQSAPATTAAPAQSQPPSQPALTGAMAELSLLTPPLQPTPTAAATQAPAQASQPASQPPATQPLQTQPTGANPSFFAQLGPQQTGVQTMSPQSQTTIQNFNPQQTGIQQQSMPPRQRPQAPPTVQQGTLAPPPVNRPTSAPQNFQQQQSAFGPPPLQPQLTGVPNIQGPQIAPPGQSLNDLSQQRFQQMQAQSQGMGQFSNGLMPQQTGYMQQQPTSSPFADPRPGQQLGFQPMSSQPTGFGGFPQQQQPMQTGSINSTLPPALQPQNTGVNGFGQNNNMGAIPPVPPIPQQPTAAPLQPQKTGPAPPVRFGVKPEAKKLAPQPTGLRANLSQATPSNPFGF